MKKIISAVLAVIFIAVMSVGSFAFSGEYFSITPPENYEEDNENSVQGALEYTEGNETVMLDGETAYFGNNYNVYVLKTNVLGLSAEDLLDEDGSFEEEYKSQIVDGYTESGYSVEFESFTSSIESTENFDYILIKNAQNLSDNTGVSVTLYQQQVMIPRGQYVVYITATALDGEESADALTNQLVNTIVVNIKDSGLGLSGIIGLLIGGFVIFILIIVVIIVAVVSSSKKKKKKQAALNAQYFSAPVQPSQPYSPQNGEAFPQQPAAAPAPKPEENTDNNGQNS